MKSRLTDGNKRKFVIIAYIIGTLAGVIAVSIGMLTMLKYGIDIFMLAITTISGLMAIYGALCVAIEVDEFINKA